MEKICLLALLGVILLLSGCGEDRLGDPMSLLDTVDIKHQPIKSAPAPKFQNGDLVRYRAANNSYGIMMYRDYKYIPKLKTYYCIVDFYPSSTRSSSRPSPENCERRYVYEYELVRLDEYPTKWASLDGLKR